MRKADILARLALAERDVESIPFGTLRIRELTRAQWRACGEAARDGEGNILIDPWRAGLFAAGVIDEDGRPMFTMAEVLAFPQRDSLWEEIARIANAVLEVSEVGTTFRGDGDTGAAAE